MAMPLTDDRLRREMGELTTDVARVTSSRLKRDPIGSFNLDQRDPSKRGIIIPVT